MNTEVINAGILDYNRLHFGWFLVDWCNYNCSYCCTGGAQSEVFSKAKSPSKYRLVLQRLARIDTDFEMDLYGGEPTLHPEFNFILSQLAAIDKCKLIEVKTNLSRSLAFFNRIYEHDKIRISASYHAEYYDQTFIDKCIALKDKDFYCHINLSDNSRDWPQIIEMIKIFDSNQVRYDFNLLYSIPGRRVNYTEEFYNTFEPYLSKTADKETYRFEMSDGTVKNISAFDAYKSKIANFKGFKCKAQSYEIKVDGEIVNLCTGTPLPISAKTAGDVVTCPLTRCESDMMLNFYKHNIDYKYNTDGKLK
jgi:organic radical activating enzyme